MRAGQADQINVSLKNKQAKALLRSENADVNPKASKLFTVDMNQGCLKESRSIKEHCADRIGGKSKR